MLHGNSKIRQVSPTPFQKADFCSQKPSPPPSVQRIQKGISYLQGTFLSCRRQRLNGPKCRYREGFLSGCRIATLNVGLTRPLFVVYLSSINALLLAKHVVVAASTLNTSSRVNPSYIDSGSELSRRTGSPPVNHLCSLNSLLLLGLLLPLPLSGGLYPSSQLISLLRLLIIVIAFSFRAFPLRSAPLPSQVYGQWPIEPQNTFTPPTTTGRKRKDGGGGEGGVQAGWSSWRT